MEKLICSVSASNLLIRTVFLCLSFCGYGQMVLSFDSVSSAIIAHNPELIMYENQAKVYDYMADGATAWDAPQLSAGFFMTPYQSNYWRDQSKEVDGMPTMMQGMGNLMVQAKQMIPNPIRLKAIQRYQKAMSSVELENQRAKANELLFKAKTVYYEAQVLDRKLKILQESRITLQTMVKLSERKLAYNQESIASIYKAKSQAALLEKDQWMMESERKQKLYALNGLMNRSNREVFSVDTFLILKNYEKMAVDSILLLQRRSDLLAIDKSIQVATLKQKAEQGKSRPDFGVEYGHMFTFGSNPNMFTLMGMMSLPIAPWSSKMYKSTIRATQYEVEAMKNQKEAMVVESLTMLQGMKLEIASTKYQLKLYKEMILPSLQKTYELSMLAYANNTGELFMALDSRMNWQMAQMQYWDTFLTLLKLQANYEKQAQL